MPAIIIGSQLAKQYGAGTAICSIFLGNLILWLVGVAIISMAIEDRVNAIENVKRYLGRSGALCMGLVLIIAFLSWFVLYINATTPSIGKYFAIDHGASSVRLGVGLGFFTTLLSIGGIRCIKWITVASFPGVFAYYLYSVLRSEFSITSIEAWGISLPAMITTIMALLPGFVNLPTFFRHAQSRADCYLALTGMTFLISLFEISSIWMEFDPFQNLNIGSEHPLFSLITLLFIVLTLICTNLVNIYFASACWESFVPRFEGAKGYAIVGLIGTAGYTFIQIYSPLRFLEDLANCYIASLGIVLLIAFLVRIIIRHRPRQWEKRINGLCWFIGCLMATLSMIRTAHDDTGPLLIGVGSSAFMFLIILFIEETIWSTKKILSQ